MLAHTFLAYTFMVTESFRRQLRHESEQWWTEGLIDAALYEKLAQRYQFDALEGDASNRFIAILMGLGGILLGLGVITFVAANWQDWSRTFRVIVLLSLFISVNVTGFYLWRRPAHKRGLQRLGHGLLLLGALILGANISLISQMFHQSGNFYELLLVWGMGVAAMAYSLRLTSLSVLALILVGWGYSSGWIAWSTGEDLSLWQFFVRHMPLVASLLFIPLAHWCRSRVVFALTAILVSASLIFNLRPLAGWSYGHALASGWIAAIAFALPPALLWAYSPQMWQWSRSRSAQHPIHAFQPIARSLAVWCFAILFYFFSFRWIWDVYPSDYYPVSQWEWQPLIDAIVLAVFAGLGWAQLRHQLRRRSGVQEKALNTGTIAILILSTAGLFFWNIELETAPALTVFLFNLMLFFLAIALVRDGLALGQRHTFWGGMVLLVLGIVTRMLEYNTDLLLKSIVFAICGVSVIGAGLWFERNARPRRLRSQPSQEGTR
ncbi:MAG: hypothetical protein Kow00121_10160 [Elainellaceae cyanobacterium]